MVIYPAVIISKEIRAYYNDDFAKIEELSKSTNLFYIDDKCVLRFTPEAYKQLNIPLDCGKVMSDDEILAIIDDIKDFDFFNIQGIRGYLNVEEDRLVIALVSAYDIAYACGLTKNNQVNYSLSDMPDKTYSYTEIRWKEFNDYALACAQALEIDPRITEYIHLPCNKDSYIPMELAVMIAMRCRSAAAVRFQQIIASRITQDIIRMSIEKYAHLQILKDQASKELIEKYETKVEYMKKYINGTGLFTATDLAKEFGMSAYQFNKLLELYGYIYKQNGKWVINQHYAHLGVMKAHDITSKRGITKTVFYWTESGRYFVYTIFTSLGLSQLRDNRELVEYLLNSPPNNK